MAKSLRAAVKPRMTPEEHLTLSPWEKCWRYRRFPFKFVVQMALLALCTAQTLYYTQQVIPYFLDSDTALRRHFFGYVDYSNKKVEARWSPPGNAGVWAAPVSSVDDLKLSLFGLVKKYDTFVGSSINRYELVPPKQVDMSIEWRDSDFWELERGSEQGSTPALDRLYESCGGSTCTFALAPGEPGFANFTDADWQSFAGTRLHNMKLRLSLRDYDAGFLHRFGQSHSSVDWDVSALFTPSSSGNLQVAYTTEAHLHLEQSTEAASPDDWTESHGVLYFETEIRPWQALCVAVGALASFSFALCAKALCSNMMNARALAQFPESLPFLRAQKKKRTSRAWLLLTMLQNVFNILSTWRLHSPTSLAHDFTATDWLLSASIFLTLVCSCRFLEWFPKYYVLVSSLAQGLPSVLRFIGGCMPMYLAYAGFGTLMFGGTAIEFASLRRSLITLFSLLNGDSMLQIFDAIYTPGWGGLASELYLISFVCLFIYSALNIFIQIMQAAYFDVHKIQERRASSVAGLEAQSWEPHDGDELWRFGSSVRRRLDSDRGMLPDGRTTPPRVMFDDDDGDDDAAETGGEDARVSRAHSPAARASDSAASLQSARAGIVAALAAIDAEIAVLGVAENAQ